MTSVHQFRDMDPEERRILMEQLAASLDHAGREGNEALESVMRVVAGAMEEAAADIAQHDIAIHLVAKAVSLIVTFRCLYPDERFVTIH